MADTFQLLGRDFEVGSERNNYMTVLRLTGELSKGVAEEFTACYKESIKSINNISYVGNIAIQLVDPIAERIVNFYVNYGIYDISKDSIIDDIVKGGDFRQHYYNINMLRESIEDEAAEAMDARREASENRGRWEGGGFGLSGALKGAATAGALNAASGLLHGAAAGIGNMGTEIAKSSKLNNLFKDPSTLSGFADGLENDVRTYFITVGKTLEEKANINIQWITVDQSNEASNIINNLNPSLPEEVKMDMIFKALEKDPRSYDCYNYIFSNYEMTEKNNVLKITDYFYIDMSDDINEHLRSVINMEKLNTLEGAEENKARVLAEMGKLGIEKAFMLDEVEKVVYARRLDDLYAKIDVCTTTIELDKLINTVDKKYYENDVEKIESKAQQKTDELCTYFDIRFSSQEEAVNQKKQHESFREEIENSSSSAAVKDIESKLLASSLHENIKQSMTESITEALFANELKEYRSLYVGSIYALTADELERVKIEAAERHFCERLADICNQEIHSAERRIKAENLTNEFDRFYSENGFAPDIMAQTLLIKTVVSELENCTDEARSMALTKIKNRFISEMNDIVVTTCILNSLQYAQKLNQSLEKNGELDKLIIYSNDPDFYSTPGTDELLAYCNIWELPIITVVAKGKAVMLITTDGIYSVKSGALIANGVSIKSKNMVMVNEIVFSCMDKSTAVNVHTNKKCAEALADVLSKLLSDISEKCGKLYQITASEPALRFYGVANTDYKSFSSELNKTIDFAYYCQYKSDLPEAIKLVFAVYLSEIVRKKLNGSTAEEFSHVKEYIGKCALEYGASIKEIDNAVKRAEANDASSIEETGVPSSTADIICRTYKDILFDKAEDIIAAKEEEPNMELIMRSVVKLNVNSINTAIEKMNTFQTKLKEHYIDILNGYLADCETDSRTYKGITYDTLEQAREAEEEFKATREFVRTVDKTNETAVKEAYEKICGNKYNSSDEIKQELKNLLADFDTAYRTVDGILFTTREEADTARTELAAITELMNAINADDEQQMIEIRQKISDMSTSIKQKYIISLDKLLADYDVKIRTFDKKVYPTREEAALVRSEFEQITALMETVSPDDEQSIVNAQMAANQMKSDIIAPYKKKLDDMWKALDIKLRTYEKFVYDTREQAQTARVTREKYLNMLNTLDMSQMSSIITLENYIEDSLTERFKSEAVKTVNDIKDVNLNAEKVFEDDKTTDPADKKACATLYKLAEKTASRMEKYRMDTTAIKAVMDKYYGSLNAGQKLFSFFKSKL